MKRFAAVFSIFAVITLMGCAAESADGGQSDDAIVAVPQQLQTCTATCDHPNWNGVPVSCADSVVTCSAYPGYVVCDGQVKSCATGAPGCLIGGHWYADGKPNPSATCSKCDAAVSTTTWSFDANGTFTDTPAFCKPLLKPYMNPQNICVLSSWGRNGSSCLNKEQCSVISCSELQ